MVGRGHVAQVGHQQVGPAVAVEVHERGVAGRSHVGDHRQAALGGGRRAAHREPVRHVGGHDLQRAVAVEVEEPHVGDRRVRISSREPQHAAREARRVLPDRRPGHRRRQRDGRAGLVVALDGFHVEVGGDRGAGAGRGADAGHHEPRHLVDLRRPGRARQDVRRRQRMAAGAGLRHDLLLGCRCGRGWSGRRRGSVGDRRDGGQRRGHGHHGGGPRAVSSHRKPTLPARLGARQGWAVTGSTVTPSAIAAGRSGQPPDASGRTAMSSRTSQSRSTRSHVWNRTDVEEGGCVEIAAYGVPPGTEW